MRYWFGNVFLYQKNIWLLLYRIKLDNLIHYSYIKGLVDWLSQSILDLYLALSIRQYISYWNGISLSQHSNLHTCLFIFHFVYIVTMVNKPRTHIICTLVLPLTIYTFCMRTTSLGGALYFVTFTCIPLMERMKSSLSCRKVFALVETKKGIKLKTLYKDSGGEYTSHDFNHFPIERYLYRVICSL